MTAKLDQELDRLIAEVTAACDDDAAAIAGFQKAIEAQLKVPTFGMALGERVQVDGVEYESPRRGVVARLRKDGRSRVISLLDVTIPGKSRGALLVRAYQRWAGVPPSHNAEPAPALTPPTTGTVDAVVLKVASETARIRPLAEDQEVTLRGSGADLWAIVPGQIITVTPKKRWTHRRYDYMSGHIEGARVDISGLGLKPLPLYDRGPVVSAENYDREFDALWQVVSQGRNVAYELERLIPGSGEREDAALAEAVDLHSMRDLEGAEKILMELLHADLRCLDAHSLLGRWSYEAKHDFLAAKGLLHFEVGVAIGEQALGPGFDGHLPLAYPGNRPFLGCLHGYGLALWRAGQAKEAEKVFERLCVLNPKDEGGARHCWMAVRHGMAWGTMPSSS